VLSPQQDSTGEAIDRQLNPLGYRELVWVGCITFFTT
jgi:hypothetical protein